ncbi:MAG: TRAP transporter large permease subunit [Calditrichaeota bacterium]|nr:TRAP transporter large permease subunit [Calditrichota bacterium]
MEGLLLALVLISLLLIRTPLFIIIAALTIWFFHEADQNLAVMIVSFTELAKQPILIAIPLFTFAGYLLSEGKTPEKLVHLSRVLFGFLPGGLAIVTLITCAFFTAFTGASGVTIIALGGLLYPILVQEKYPERFSLGLITTSGSLGLLFFPSLPLILYGIISETDILSLFKAGILPGILLILILSFYSVKVGHSRQISKTENPFESIQTIISRILSKELAQLLVPVLVLIVAILINELIGKFIMFLLVILSSYLTLRGLVKLLFKETVIVAFNGAKYIIFLPILVVAGIYSGQFTATQSAAVTATYVFVMEFFLYKDISIKKDLVRLVNESMSLVGAILIIMTVALAFTNYLIDEDVPTLILESIQTHIDSKLMFLIVLNIFLLIVGSIMDIFSAIMVVVPLIIPLAREYGVDPVHLGIIFLTNLEIGYLTPPIGMNLFISSFRFNKNIFTLYRSVLVYILLLLLALIIITYVPELSLFFV